MHPKCLIAPQKQAKEASENTERSFKDWKYHVHSISAQNFKDNA